MNFIHLIFLPVYVENKNNYYLQKFGKLQKNGTDVYRLHIFGFGPFTRFSVLTKFVYDNFIYFRHRHVEIYPACSDKVILISEVIHAPIRRTYYGLKLFLLYDFIVFFDAEKNLLVYFVLHFSSLSYTVIHIHHSILQSGST